jgi:hypothetical protein
VVRRDGRREAPTSLRQRVIMGSVRYMVVENFTQGAAAVYERARVRGRMLPEGLLYLDSWVVADGLDRCFQLMETDDPSLFDEWTARWSDLAEFDILPVISSAEAAERA